MTNLIACLLTLLLSLNGPAMEGNADFWHSPFAAKRGETAFTKAGRDAHKLYNPGPSYDLRVRLPSGKKPDAVDFDARIVRELKPNNPRAIQRGQRQVEPCRKELEETFGGDWKSVVDIYNR